MRRTEIQVRNNLTSAAVLLTVVCLSAFCKPPSLDDYQESLLRGHSNPSSTPASDEDQSLILATIDGEPITLADFHRRLNSLGTEDQRRVSSEAARRRLLSAIVDLHLFAAEAVDAGLSGDPMVVQAERSAIRDVVLDSMAAPRLPTPSNISDIEVRHVYAEESFRFRRPELVRVGLIVAPERSDAVSLLDEYRRRLELDIQSSMALFERLATEYSIAPPQALDLGFVSREQLSEFAHHEAIEAVFALNNPGQSTSPIPVAGGWAIFVLIEQRRAIQHELDEVAESIRERVVAGRRVDAIDVMLSRLRENAEIQIDEELLARLESAATNANPIPAREAWESRSTQELDTILTLRHDIGFLGGLLLQPREEPPPAEVTNGDEGE